MTRSFLLLLLAVVAGLFAFGRLTVDTYVEGAARALFFLLCGAYVMSLFYGLSSPPDRRR